MKLWPVDAFLYTFPVLTVGSWSGNALTVAVDDTPLLELSVNPILIVVAVSATPVQFHWLPKTFPLEVLAMFLHQPVEVEILVATISVALSVSVVFANTTKLWPVVALV